MLSHHQGTPLLVLAITAFGAAIAPSHSHAYVLQAYCSHTFPASNNTHLCLAHTAFGAAAASSTPEPSMAGMPSNLPDLVATSNAFLFLASFSLVASHVYCRASEAVRGTEGGPENAGSSTGLV
jgi:hypothetical protein